MKKEQKEKVVPQPLPQVEIDHLRKDDFVFCYWTAGGGNFAWLVERGNQLFMFVVLGMSYLYIRHWAYSGDQSSVDVVRNVVACMGFQEHPIYASFHNAKDKLRPLGRDLEMYENTMKQRFEEQVKQANAAKNNITNVAEGTGSDAKVKDIADAKKEKIN